MTIVTLLQAVIMRDSSGSESFARGCGIPDNRDNMTCTDHQNEQCYDVTMPDGTLGKVSHFTHTVHFN